MIWESADWKKPLLRVSKQVKKWKKKKDLSDKDFVDIEKAILIAFYSIRKLVDARKLSNATQEMKINISSYPNVKNVTLMNWHKIDELYNLKKENREKRNIAFIYNQLIHSYVFMIGEKDSGGFDGIFFSSDSQRNKKLYKICVDELIRIINTVGNDYPSRSEMKFNEEKQDFDVFLASHSAEPGKKYLCKPYTESDCWHGEKEAFTRFCFWVEFYLSWIWCDFQRILRTSGGGLIENFLRILLCSLLASVVLMKVALRGGDTASMKTS